MQTNDGLRIVKQDNRLCFKPLYYSGCYPRCMEEDATAYFRVVTVEAVPDKVNRCNMRTDVVHVLGNGFDLPTGLDLQAVLPGSKGNDITY